MARALGAAALVAALVVVACGGSGPEEAAPPATEPPATEAPATEAATQRAAATRAPATESPTPRSATSTPAAAPGEPEEGVESDDLRIVTLLPPDAIAAINNPTFISLEEADQQLRLSDLVIGVTIGGEHRAYGAAFLSAHEIVNDTLGGRAIAVTW